MNNIVEGAKEYGGASLDVLKGDIEAVVDPIEKAAGKEDPNAKAEDQSKPKRPPNPARKVQEVAGSIGAVLGLPMQLVNDGFALITAPLAAIWPSLPAAAMGSMYIGPPHPHKHPPSWVPPAPPVPLPSIGMVMLGCCVKVLINGMPAARAGDLGLAPTCGGFVPFFEIKTGSSNVFIGGARAARLGDECMACAQGSGSMKTYAKVMMAVNLAAGNVAGIAGVIADKKDAAASSAEHDEAMAAAQSLSAAMGAAQLAADAAATAVRLLMGKDDAIPPLPGDLIAISNVLIGGFPMENLPDPLHMLFEKLGKLRKGGQEREGENSRTRCETCEGG